MLNALKDMLARAENNQGAEVMLKEFAAAYPLPEIRSFVDVFCAAKYSGGSLNLVIRSTAAQIAQNGNPTIVFTHFALSVSKMIKHL